MKIVLLLGLFAVVLGQNSPYYRTDPEDIRKGFIAVDFNHDDSLTRAELVQFIKQVDFNGDGFITYTEYNLTKPSEIPESYAKGEFGYYDKLDGVVNGNITYSIADHLMNIFDSNKDGHITFQEFQQNIVHVIDGMTREIDGLVG